MTMGPGDAIWERFRHNAIWIRNRTTGTGAIYNWGIFDFDQVDFIPRLIRGTMLYSMAAYQRTDAFVEAYRRVNRSVWIQELALTPEEKVDLLAFARWNARPENRDYRYDYYRDNCSTRVRDALDRVLKGRIREVAEADTTRHTYRWHTRRLLQAVPAAYAGIQLVLGAAADRPLTRWEEMFLPRVLMEEVRRVEVPDGQGGMRSLVIHEEELVTSTRAPLPDAPTLAFPLFLLAGLVFGGVILTLSRGGGPRGWPGRLALSTLAGTWFLAAAAAGLLLAGAWAFTDHVFWYRNLNLLQVNPLALPLPVAYVIYAARGGFPRWARDMAAALAVLSGVGVLLWVLPGFRQANGEILALTVPVNLSLALGAHWLLMGSPQICDDGAGPGA